MQTKKHVKNNKKVSKQRVPNRPVKRSIKKKKPPKKVSKTFAAIIILIFSLMILAALMFSSYFNIQNVKVINNKHATALEIIELSGITIGDNTFKYINYKMKEQILLHPYIKDVNIYRNFPAEVCIEIDERVEKYIFNVNDEIYYIDNEGYILNKISSIPEDNTKLEITGGATEIEAMVIGQQLSLKDVQNILNINQILKHMEDQELTVYIISIDLSESGAVALNLKEDKTVYIESYDNLSIQISYLKNIMELNKDKAGEIHLEGQSNGWPIFNEKV